MQYDPNGNPPSYASEDQVKKKRKREIEGLYIYIYLNVYACWYICYCVRMKGYNNCYLFSFFFVVLDNTILNSRIFGF